MTGVQTCALPISIIKFYKFYNEQVKIYEKEHEAFKKRAFAWVDEFNELSEQN